MCCPERTSRYDDPAARAGKFRNRWIDRIGIVQINQAQLHPYRSYCLDCGKLADSGGSSGIAEPLRASRSVLSL
jgi:hypothetical protein